MGSPVPQRIKAFFYDIGQEEPASKEKWWVLLRWCLLGVVILATLIGNTLIQLSIPSLKVFVLCAITFLINAFFHYYYFVIKKDASVPDRKVVNRINSLQFGIDWAFIALIFHYTGGIASPLLFYFLFHVILTGVLLERRSCLFYVTLVAFTINALAVLELFAFIPHGYRSSFISQQAQSNPYFVLMCLFFFDTLLYVSSYFVVSLSTSLRERIIRLEELQQELEHANRQLALLNQVAKDIASTFGFYPRLSFVCQSIMEIMNVKGVAIRLLDEKSNQLKLATACGLSDEYINKGPVDADKSLAKALEGEPHFVFDASTDQSLQYPEAALKEGIVSMLAFPLKGKEKVIGTLRLYCAERRVFSQNELEFISALANHGAISIENAKIYDALQRQDEAKSDFIMLMTHELKAPLMAIQGLLEVMLKGYVGSITEKQKELMERIDSRIESVMEVSTGLLDIYQWQSRSEEVKWVPVSIKEQIHKAIEMLKDSAKRKGISLDVTLPDENILLMATEDEIEKILNNLITNAIKYTPGGGNISLKLSSSGDQVILSIGDTGIGIAEDEIPKIFEQFFRTQEAKKIDPYGKGLGLPFVKKIVKTLGGEIQVKSEKDKGTEFILSFPRVSLPEGRS
jgi:signal transduction histidine kinase